jgi:leader peptidase (prepilin peptidase)/N-methyltransferase
VNLPKTAAFVIASPPAAWLLTRFAARLSGSPSISLKWMSTGVLFVAVSAATADTAATISFGLGLTLLLLTAVDLAAFRLPDIITLPLALAGLCLPDTTTAPYVDRVVGLVLAPTVICAVDYIYLSLRGRPGIGLGDAKLLGVAGAWLGWGELTAVLLLACAGGLVWVALRILKQGRLSARHPLPFGAPICAAFWLLWLLNVWDVEVSV